MEPSELFLVADVIATIAHHGQVDKAGQPYIEHPRRVTQLAYRAADQSGVNRFDVMTVARLHDVVEDTPVTLELLYSALPVHIVDAVDAITYPPGEPRDVYYARVAANELAFQVTLADIADNSDPDRLAVLDPETRDRLTAKYSHALKMLHELRGK